MNEITAQRATLMSTTVAEMIQHPSSPSLLVAYFDPFRPFAGRTFWTMAPNEPNRILAIDLFATTLLDVGFPPRSVRWFLDPKNAAALTALMSGLPSPGLELTALQRADLSGAELLWRLIAHREVPPDCAVDPGELRLAMHGVRAVKADKLLARKRPMVFPVYDSAFERLFGPRDANFDYWTVTAALLETSRPRDFLLAAAGEDVPVVRALDALIWTWESRSDNAEKARRDSGIRDGATWSTSHRT